MISKRSYRPDNIREIHRANLLRSLEYRLEAARKKGDDNLIGVLQAEREYYSHR